MALEEKLEPVRIKAIRDMASDVRLFELEPSRGVRPFQVGSHLDVEVVVNGRHERRSYSLVGEGPEADRYCIAVKNRPQGHGGSRYLWSLHTGDSLRVSAPRDTFPLSYHDCPYLLVAGGIGITPIYGMAMALARRGADIRLLYAVHSTRQLAFVDSLRERLGDRMEIFSSEQGRRMDPSKAVESLAEDAELYFCGPLSLREDFQSAWAAAGRPLARFRFETFASSGWYPEEPFDVEVANRGVRFTVARDQSLLQALQLNGVDEVLYDCEHGECGLCTVRVLRCSGTIDHWDVFYSKRQRQSGDRICTCVSRVVRGGLVIDTSTQAVDTGRSVD